MELGENRFFGQFVLRGLGDAKIDDLGNGNSVVERDENIGWLDIAMDHTFLMRVLDGLADRYEQIEAFPVGQLVFVAVLRDGHSSHQFHDKVGAPAFSRPCVQDFGDVRMIHHRQGLALGFEAGDDLPGVHPELDDFQGDAALDRLFLLSHVNHAEATLAEFLKKFVTPDLGAWFLQAGIGF